MTAATTTPANGNGNGAQTKAIEKAPTTRIGWLKKHFDDWKPTLAAVLPKHIDPDRVIKIAMAVYMNKPELALCTPLSMVKATMQCAELGLDPSPLLGEAAFVPFKAKKKVQDGNQWKDVEEVQVQLMPMYTGLVKLAKQTGDVSDVYAVPVYDSEKTPVWGPDGRLVSGFCVEEGTVRKIHHIRKLDGARGAFFAVYGVVKFKDGTCHFEVLSKEDVDDHRKVSKQANGSAWTDNYVAMACKTAIRMTVKTVPKSTEKPGLAHALAIDTANDLGEAFRGDLMADVIDTTGESAPDSSPMPVDAQDAPKAKAERAPAGGRTADLSAKLGGSGPKEKPTTTVPYDQATGEVKDAEPELKLT